MFNYLLQVTTARKDTPSSWKFFLEYSEGGAKKKKLGKQVVARNSKQV
jgi:hypothetical protein